MNAMQDLTQTRLKELMHYDPNTGVFTWRVAPRRSRLKKGDAAGSYDAKGARQIKIDGQTYRAHRLAWLYVHGIWPAVLLDHVNGKPGDNRLRNLREATYSQNAMNQAAQKDGTSGAKNVYHQAGKWVVRMRAQGHDLYFGRYDDLELAELVAVEARDKYHGVYANHGGRNALQG